MNKKILIVDDEVNIGLLLENFLSEQYDVTYKSNTNEAFMWLEENLPDLVICDIQMPECDGYEILKSIRNRGFTIHTPVVMLSSKSESNEKIKCYKLGAQDYLTKPFNPEELEEVIKKNLNPLHYSVSW
ncbi:MAG: response regulator [Bacteroidia bacterium]|nr:response regulator [Bacteroidia bacterium]